METKILLGKVGDRAPDGGIVLMESLENIAKLHKNFLLEGDCLYVTGDIKVNFN